jgi:hypothetical protein
MPPIPAHKHESFEFGEYKVKLFKCHHLVFIMSSKQKNSHLFLLTHLERIVTFAYLHVQNQFHII